MFRIKLGTDNIYLIKFKNNNNHKTLMSLYEIREVLKREYDRRNIEYIKRTEIYATMKVSFSHFRPKDPKGYNLKLWDEICQEQ